MICPWKFFTDLIAATSDPFEPPFKTHKLISSITNKSINRTTLVFQEQQNTVSFLKNNNKLFKYQIFVYNINSSSGRSY